MDAFLDENLKAVLVGALVTAGLALLSSFWAWFKAHAAQTPNKFDDAFVRTVEKVIETKFADEVAKVESKRGTATK